SSDADRSQIRIDVYFDEVGGVSTGARAPVDGAVYGMKRPSLTIIVADEVSPGGALSPSIVISSRRWRVRMSAYVSKRAGSSVICMPPSRTVMSSKRHP